MTQVSERGDELSGEDRRVAPRHAYGIVQQVAEMQDGQLPRSDTFTRVQIVDLSSSGFAYYAMTEPNGDEVVVIMGDPPNLSCMRARIVYARPVEEFGHQFFRVGCQFTGTAEIDVQRIVEQYECGTEDMLQDLSGLSEFGEAVETD